MTVTENPYTPPKSAVAVKVREPNNTQAFLPISQRKLAIMFWGTVGFYPIYLFYKNWALQKQATSANVMPVMRGLFSIFFAHELYKLADMRLSENGERHDWDIDALATTYIVLVIAAKVLNWMTIAQPLPQLLATALMFWIYRVIARAQDGLNLAAGDPRGLSNSTLTWANYCWILAGAWLWFATTVKFIAMM